MTHQSYSPSGAASCLKEQGTSTMPRGAGTKPAMAKDSVRAPGMSHGTAKVGAVLDRKAPENDGPCHSY